MWLAMIQNIMCNRFHTRRTCFFIQVLELIHAQWFYAKWILSKRRVSNVKVVTTSSHLASREWVALSFPIRAKHADSCSVSQWLSARGEFASVKWRPCKHMSSLFTLQGGTVTQREKLCDFLSKNINKGGHSNLGCHVMSSKVASDPPS